MFWCDICWFFHYMLYSLSCVWFICASVETIVLTVCSIVLVLLFFFSCNELWLILITGKLVPCSSDLHWENKRRPFSCRKSIASFLQLSSSFLFFLFLTSLQWVFASFLYLYLQGLELSGCHNCLLLAPVFLVGCSIWLQECEWHDGVADADNKVKRVKSS